MISGKIPWKRSSNGRAYATDSTGVPDVANWPGTARTINRP